MAKSDAGPIDTPEWVKHAVFYQIFPDRFAMSDRVLKPYRLEPWSDPPTTHGYKGGDLWGVVERLDWLADLGVTALYLNPVFQSASNHRYHTHDYHRVDPMLGGDEALRGLVDGAHDRGMKIVLDGVFNHASRGFFQFSDILENGGKSAYRDWFRVHAFPLNAYGEGLAQYESWMGLPALPEFDTDNESVREFLFDVGTRWLEFGIDGWRLDVPNEIDDDAFWQEFRRRCREVDPDCYLVGEIWGDAGRWLQGDQFDAVMNYPLARRIFGFVADELGTAEIEQSGYRRIERADAATVADGVTFELDRYAREVVDAQLNLLGSHDTPRLRTILGGDSGAVRLAFTMLFTLPGAPCIYYGDEIGLTGGRDPDCRQGMPWDRRETWDDELLEWVRELARLRGDHVELRTGTFETIHAEGELFVYARGGRQGVVVAVNAGTNPEAVDWQTGEHLAPGRWTAVIGQGRFEVESGRAHGAGGPGIPARESVVFRPDPGA